MATVPHTRRPAVCESCRRDYMARTDSQGRFCSRACSMRERNRNSVGLSYQADGRCVIRCRDGAHMFFYRAVVAAQIGRLLRRDEIVHHVDGDPSNDDPANLEVMSRGDHVRLHQRRGEMTNISNWRG